MKTNSLFQKPWKSRVAISQVKSPERLAIATSLVLSVFFLSACQGQDRLTECRRVTSPNGRFDAVLVTDMYGPAAGGGVDSNVYIVPKGAPVHVKSGSEVFSADPMSCGELVWRRDHLLEIHYNIAYIHHFRNTWGLYEVENVGSRGERDYEVEIRLMPASDSSALQPDGSFRHIGYEPLSANCF